MIRSTIAVLATLWLWSNVAAGHDAAADPAATLTVIDQAFVAVASGVPDDRRAMRPAEGTPLSLAIQ